MHPDSDRLSAKALPGSDHMVTKQRDSGSRRRSSVPPMLCAEAEAGRIARNISGRIVANLELISRTTPVLTPWR